MRTLISFAILSGMTKKDKPDESKRGSAMKAFEALEFLVDYGLYNMEFRNQGVGLAFYDGPKTFPRGYNFKQHLKVEKYYPSAQEAILAAVKKYQDA